MTHYHRYLLKNNLVLIPLSGFLNAESFPLSLISLLMAAYNVFAGVLPPGETQRASVAITSIVRGKGGEPDRQISFGEALSNSLLILVSVPSAL